MNPTTENQKLGIKLSVDEVNTILGALGTRPYEEVAGLIASIMGQANAGLAARRNAENEDKDRPQPKHAEDKDKNE